MTSKYFTPGKTSVRSRVFSSYYYNDYNNITTLNTFKNYFPCQCNNSKKVVNIMDGYANMSTAQLRADIIQNSNGSKVGFGNYNFGGNYAVNYLGRVEGQNGGGGKPIRNQF
jgi:hypothetical protein